MTDRRVVALAVLLAGAAQGSALAAGAKPTLDIVSRVPKFEAFYRQASTQNLSEPDRWALWKKEYGIAAVPPTPEGDALARKQLDAVWPRYAALLPRLAGKEAEEIAAAQDLFGRVNRVFETQTMPIHSELLLFVGEFDGNEFTVPAMNGKPATVVMPVENPDFALDVAHELAHTVHFQLAGVRNGFGAPIGETIFLEGLAMHAAKTAVPGLPDARYTELASEPGWLSRCAANEAAVEKGIAPYLDRSGPDVATRFTFGKGTTGMDRELYCAAWFAVGKMLHDGETLPQLARIPEKDMIETVRRVLVHA